MDGLWESSKAIHPTECHQNFFGIGAGFLELKLVGGPEHVVGDVSQNVSDSLRADEVHDISPTDIGLENDQ